MIDGPKIENETIYLRNTNTFKSEKFEFGVKFGKDKHENWELTKNKSIVMKSWQKQNFPYQPLNLSKLHYHETRSDTT